MITIQYTYFQKKTGKWMQGETTFDSLCAAIRFCWSIQRRPDMYLDGWTTWSVSLNEEMSHKVNMWAINHRKEVKAQ